MKGRNSCWLAPAAFVLDRLTKLLAQKALAPGVRTDALPGLFRFVLVKNTGAAFSMLSGRQGLLIGVTALALIAMIVFQLTRGRKRTPLFRAGLWLLIGGAAGNLFDRIAYGGVIDFIETAFIRFPVFNVADICICVAFGLIALATLLEEREHRKNA